MEYEVVIGLEVHAQLLTKSKMFCGCSSEYAGAAPNTHVCPVCLGMPGVLPVINQQAVKFVVMTGLALNCTIAEYSKFDRKNYPYPDLMKGYQISQYDLPIALNGWLTVSTNGQERRVGIIRVHLEEDVAKLFHRASPEGETYSLLDVNRAGVPLMEIVSAPDMRSADEAREYLVRLRSILQYLGVSTGNMEEGSFRCDANISIRPKGDQELPKAKVEVKNMNSFRAVFRALEYEAERQKKVLAGGGAIVQETRGWVEEKGVTVSQRTKEYAHDYRYFPEPDLPPLTFTRPWVEEVRGQLPELPEARKARFVAQYSLPLYDAQLLTGSKAVANYFEACLALNGKGAKRAKAVSNWILGEFNRLLNAANAEIDSTRVKPARLVELIEMVDAGALSSTAAKAVFEEMFNSGESAAQIAARKGLTQVSQASDLDSFVEQALAQNHAAVVDYKAGKTQAVAFLVGQVMRLSKGRANPQVVTSLIKKKLDGTS
ncbi:MAG: Asp-tRNA(Asn)/Glu-tRNA(Gln) amidotransferase subunit GatB [Chloroflexi bacterium]|nr:Asp-tRNA(Asn)/Glu-tRNA(Gln) amidotransferase subunit GatB [Chloroflexota bacterium]